MVGRSRKVRSVRCWQPWCWPDWNLPAAAAAQSGDLVARWVRNRTRLATVSLRCCPPMKRAHYPPAVRRDRCRTVDAGRKPACLAPQRDIGSIGPGRVLHSRPTAPMVSAEQIAAWFNAGVDLPQAEQLARMGAKRGVEYLPPRLPSEQRVLPASHPRPSAFLGGGGRARSMMAPCPPLQASAILEAIKSDNPGRSPAPAGGGRLAAFPAMPAPNGASAWRGATISKTTIPPRSNWARTVAEKAPANGSPKAHGVEGLGRVAAGALFARERCLRPHRRGRGHPMSNWAPPGITGRNRFAGGAGPRAGAGTAAPQGRRVDGRNALRHARRRPTRYRIAGPCSRPRPFGKRGLGETALTPHQISASPFALAEIGAVSGLADESAAPRGADRHHRQASMTRSPRLAARNIGLPATQLWMAHNAPYGARSDPSLRFPVARWQPVGGWQVDPLRLPLPTRCRNRTSAPMR